MFVDSVDSQDLENYRVFLLWHYNFHSVIWLFGNRFSSINLCDTKNKKNVEKLSFKVIFVAHRLQCDVADELHCFGYVDTSIPHLRFSIIIKLFIQHNNLWNFPVSKFLYPVM